MRQAVQRRALFCGIAAAGGTLAVAGRLGKPSAQAAPGAALPGIEALRRTDPPAKLPPAGLVDAGGGVHRLEEFSGQGLVLNLWATWCVPCGTELPALAALAARLADAAILVLPLSSDRGGAPIVEQYYRSHGIAGLPVWLDPKGAAARAWGARGLPTTLIVDRQGRERGRIEGPLDWASDPVVAEIRRLAG
jgi:thiol-disulfide isomerase/thioredoxin